MLARGYISDNWHFPDAEFLQIVAGMRRLKSACDELATASAANIMATMQEIAEAVLQLVKDCGKKLTKTIETNNYVPPPGPGVHPAQVILKPILLPLNAPPHCQWSSATAVPNAGPVVQNAPGPMLLGQPKTYISKKTFFTRGIEPASGQASPLFASRPSGSPEASLPFISCVWYAQTPHFPSKASDALLATPPPPSAFLLYPPPYLLVYRPPAYSYQLRASGGPPRSPLTASDLDLSAPVR